ncbi:hypothetical protein JCM19237_257 [Photobacterium aphoticum]|uniref:Uncharacterized protein n=1 Tax=Photobacterium aphoticum TaxID=754436 RepID=A0A090RK49_9GAMM|nr:hypothetical protein JCM19237_257 [Photobacterium aphoticum]
MGMDWHHLVTVDEVVHRIITGDNLEEKARVMKLTQAIDRINIMAGRVSKKDTFAEIAKQRRKVQTKSARGGKKRK